MALEDRCWLSGGTTIQLDFAAGVNIAVTHLPAGANSFTGISTSASGGVAFQSPINASQVVYQSGGLLSTDTFAFSDNTAAGQTQSFGVTVQIPVLPPPPVVPPPPVLPPVLPPFFNPPPDAVNDTFGSMHGRMAFGSVAGNDVFISIGTPTFSIVNSGANGVAVINSTTGYFTFTPSSDFTGPTTFTYKVTNQYGSDTATVTIVYSNTAPFQTFVTEFDAQMGAFEISGNVFPYCRDNEGDSIAYSSGGSSGLTMSSNGDFTYRLPSGNFGTLIVAYKATDSGGLVTNCTFKVNCRPPIVNVLATGKSTQESKYGFPLPGEFRIYRTGNTSTSLTVNFTLTGAAGAYTADATNSVTFLPGSSEALVHIWASNNHVVDDPRQVVFTLTRSSDYVISNNQDAVNITDNDFWRWKTVFDTDLLRKDTDITTVIFDHRIITHVEAVASSGSGSISGVASVQYQGWSLFGGWENISASITTFESAYTFDRQTGAISLVRNQSGSTTTPAGLTITAALTPAISGNSVVATVRVQARCVLGTTTSQCESEVTQGLETELSEM